MEYKQDHPDPFDDTNNASRSLIHIRIQQRNGRKTWTIVQGLQKQFDTGKILKVLKKQLACNGKVVVDEHLGQVLQLSGDQRSKVAEFLVKEDVARKQDIHIHGF